METSVRYSIKFTSSKGAYKPLIGPYACQSDTQAIAYAIGLLIKMRRDNTHAAAYDVWEVATDGRRHKLTEACDCGMVRANNKPRHCATVIPAFVARGIIDVCAT